MNMAQLEEQAKMNWYARCAAGPAHARIPEKVIEESDGRLPLSQLPHFRDSMSASVPQLNGTWMYYADLVSKGIV